MKANFSTLTMAAAVLAVRPMSARAFGIVSVALVIEGLDECVYVLGARVEPPVDPKIEDPIYPADDPTWWLDMGLASHTVSWVRLHGCDLPRIGCIPSRSGLDRPQVRIHRLRR